MMLLSRFWYAILAVLAGFAVYAVMLAVGQYNRASIKGTNETLADDSNVVQWDVQIDSRHRIDALMGLALDSTIQHALLDAMDKDKIPPKSRQDAAKGIAAAQDKIPAQYKPDAIFVVDRDGRVVAESGYAAADKFDDFELGGYSSVNDALHGWLRDDTWVWGNTIYRVAARPVEYDVAQPPVGAIVGIRALDKRYAQDLVKDTKTNIVFYAAGQKVSAAGLDNFDDAQAEAIVPELAKLDADQEYKTKGHTEIRNLAGTTNLGAVFRKLDGDAYELGAGYAVVRPRVTIANGGAFLSNADETDRKNVSWPGIIGIVVAGLVFGLLLTFVEHDRPLKKMRVQALKLKKGEIDLLQLPQLSGGLRDIGADVNAGIERVAEKGGGAPRKAADLESILGPVPAEPSMSAFAFPMSEPSSAVRQSNPLAPPGSGPKPLPMQAPPPPASNPNLSGPRPPPPHPSSPGSRPGFTPNAPPNVVAMPPPRLQQPETSPTTVMPLRAPDGPSAPAAVVPKKKEDEEEATMVAAVPQEVLARAIGEAQNPDELEWPNVYEEFVKTKKQCSEPTEGLTFDKFRQTLRKNRDALVQRHNCKRVKFTVYVKDGRASLKATPIKD
ncbi:MAG TPA: MXAN_5187 family protein [Polyangiaceae bacterium]|jgi:hypothetical protein